MNAEAVRHESHPGVTRRLVTTFQEHLFPSMFEDELTGLGNRRAFNRELDRNVRKQPGNFALLGIDLDGLKELNDRDGHEAGDNYIQLAARTIHDSIRAEEPGAELAVGHHAERRTTEPREPEVDQLFTKQSWLGKVARRGGLHKVFRWGGDELPVILSDVSDPQIVVSIVARIEKNLAQKGIAASIGWALHEPNMDALSLSALADQAMYTVKASRKAQQQQEKLATLPLHRKASYYLGKAFTQFSGMIEPRR